MVRVIVMPALVAAFIAGSAASSVALAADPILTDQGPNWTQVTREDFYSRDQGSRMIPLAWLQNLKQANGQPFLDGSLSRYGYLPNPANTNGLPVGFTTSGASGLAIVGMTCSACHTRQLTNAGQSYRIDGGPAIVDFQSFLTDLDSAVGQVLGSDATFNPFAAAVLSSSSPDADDVAALRQDVNAWYLRFHTLMTRALPSPGWGPSRLDAVGMIFNRLTGLDLGPPPDFLIADNIQKADAPVRYPFIWNAPIQDHTQWTGFADNGSDVLALSRNLGEVFGVFGVFEPTNDGLIINFLNNNSANFDGLGKLENLVRQIGPPKWPWQSTHPIDAALALQGQEIFGRPQANGGCIECHGVAPGKLRFPAMATWATPIVNVGTDTRAHDILAWGGKKTGVLKGAFIPFATQPLGDKDQAFNILATAVIGSIAEQALRGGASPSPGALVATGIDTQIQNAPYVLSQAPKRLPPALRELQGAFHPPTSSASTSAAPNLFPNLRVQGLPIPNLIAPATPLPPKGAYEARVMQGIWATAPYLHNGSVPSLVELLKPAAQRVKQFKLGPAYDPDTVGLAAEQTQFDYTVTTTDCSNLNSGSSNCGHEFGTQLSAPEKKALLEYLKTL
jgi:mono/diheme cytochrome c family protein